MDRDLTGFENTLIVRLLPKDTNAHGHIFGGVIMSWMDQGAAVTAQRHCRCRVVTASADELTFHRPILVGEILTVKTKLVYTGKTSMEVEVVVETENVIKNTQRIGVTGFFTMVAVDDTGKPIPVEPIKLDTPEVKMKYEQALERRKRKGL